MGYLLNDKRGAGGELEEYDTVACRHCQAVIKLVHRQQQGAFCRICMGPVCDTPKCATRCTPFFKTIEEKLRRQALFKSMGI